MLYEYNVNVNFLKDLTRFLYSQVLHVFHSEQLSVVGHTHFVIFTAVHNF